MAIKKKSSGKALTQRARKIIKGDVKKSVAVASVLLNVLFLISIVVITNVGTFDRNLYTAARDRYCRNEAALITRIQELDGDFDQATREHQIDCIDESFKPFYQEALDKFNAQP